MFRKEDVRSRPGWQLNIVGLVKYLSQSPPWSERLPRFDNPAIILLASFGTVLSWVAFGPFAIYPPAGFIDPWFYTGYFTNFSYLLLQRGFTYYVSRLPWILPGRAAFGIASPEFASLLLCAAIVTISAVSVYYMVRWYYGHPSAILAALALITNPDFMSTTGWQYPDGAAIAYATVALALYLRPHGSPGWNDSLAAAALTLSAFTNVAGAPLIVSLFLIPLWRCRHSAKELRRLLLCTLAGAGVTTVLLCGVSNSVLGDARIFKPQLDIWLTALHNPTYLSDTWGSGPGFLMHARRLFTPLFLLIFGPVLLLASRKPAASVWPVYFALLTCCSIYAFQEFVLNRAGLRVPYVSSYMMVLVACFVGMVLGELWKSRQPSRPAVAFSALAILAIVLPFVYNEMRLRSLHHRVWPILFCVGIAAVVLAILDRGPKPFARYAISALVLIAVSAGPAADDLVFSGLGDRQSIHGWNLSAGPRAASFRCLLNIQDYLKSNIDPQWKLVFWIDKDEPLNGLFRSAVALYVTQDSDLAHELSSGSGRLYPYNTTVVQMTAHPERLAEHKKLFASRGINVDYERRTELSYGDYRFTVALQDLKAQSSVY